MNVDKIKQMCFDVIRRESSKYDRETTLNELGAYVKGVVDTETEIYEYLINESISED